MIYLLDTNIWLERLLAQEKSDEVGQFLGQVSSDRLLMTDFTLHSIGVILFRLQRWDVFPQFVQDVFVDGATQLISLEPSSMKRLIDVSVAYGLDFDDAYQYVAAEMYDAMLVSFDRDFDRTERGRMTPSGIIQI